MSLVFVIKISKTVELFLTWWVKNNDLGDNNYVLKLITGVHDSVYYVLYRLPGTSFSWVYIVFHLKTLSTTCGGRWQNGCVRREERAESMYVLLWDHEGSSRVDGDDFASTSAHQEDPIETFSEHLKKLHVWETIAVKELVFFPYSSGHSLTLYDAKVHFHLSEVKGLHI